jgi:beta-phosphoglucomutase
VTAIAKDKGVIFDLDGVLVDTASFHKQAWLELAQREGFQMTEKDFYSTFGMQNYKILPLIACRNLSEQEIKKLSDAKEQRYRELICGKLPLLEGVESLIKDLKKTGFLLAIGTSAPKANLASTLEQLPIWDYFDACVTSEEVTRSKPAPDTFLKAAEKLSLSPRCCVVVEDSLQGLEAGKAAGMAVAAVTNTRTRRELAKADLIVDSLAELKAADFSKLLK